MIFHKMCVNIYANSSLVHIVNNLVMKAALRQWGGLGPLVSLLLPVSRLVHHQQWKYISPPLYLLIGPHLYIKPLNP